MAAGESYEEFVAKFNKKKEKTTDDCYTPQGLYEDILSYCCNRYGIKRAQVIRPFYPGGDYKAENYEGRVVVDNPPFSIMKEIVTWYDAAGVKFFLFCSALTPPFYADIENNWTLIMAGDTVTYENGAKVNTGFVTNMEPGVVVRTSPTLYRILKNNRPPHKLEKVQKPKNILQPYDIQFLSKRGVRYSLSTDDVITHTAKSPDGRRLYGRGWIVTDEKAEEYHNEKAKYIREPL